MTTTERHLRASCPYSYHNGNEGYICTHRPLYDHSSLTPAPSTLNYYSHRKCNGCNLMYKIITNP